jgi:hypothetical protein
MVKLVMMSEMDIEDMIMMMAVKGIWGKPLLIL